ncbi:hypothetical protein ACIGO9_19795 [Nocardia asteroides]|uniref:hypothetical protein n=2 Tax=Nocardia asteroides TaxID=1824 RepID=UPI0037CB6B53
MTTMTDNAQQRRQRELFEILLAVLHEEDPPDSRTRITTASSQLFAASGSEPRRHGVEVVHPESGVRFRLEAGQDGVTTLTVTPQDQRSAATGDLVCYVPADAAPWLVVLYDDGQIVTAQLAVRGLPVDPAGSTSRRLALGDLTPADLDLVPRSVAAAGPGLNAWRNLALMLPPNSPLRAAIVTGLTEDDSEGQH